MSWSGLEYHGDLRRWYRDGSCEAHRTRAMMGRAKHNSKWADSSAQLVHCSFHNHKVLTVWTWPEAHVWLMMGSLRACPDGSISSKHLEQRKKTVEHTYSRLPNISTNMRCLHLYQLGLCRSNQVEVKNSDREFHGWIESRVVFECTIGGRKVVTIFCELRLVHNILLLCDSSVTRSRNQQNMLKLDITALPVRFSISLSK